MRSILLSLVLALPLPLFAALGADPAQERGAGTAQEPAKGEPREEKAKTGDVDIFGRPQRTTGDKTGTNELLEGCWKLTDIELTGLIDNGRKAAGALLVHDNFLAFEVHMAWPGSLRRPTVHQSFIAEYELSQGRQLKVTTVIGSFVDQRLGVLDWEEPSFVRDYQVSITGDRLELTFGQGNKMSFARQRSAGEDNRDIFGRERREPVGERDIFGRPKRSTGDAEAPQRESSTTK
jgi:hypothetical protein